MSIAILLPDLRPGGAERLHLHLAREWLESGIAVEFVLRQAKGELMAHLPQGAKVVDLGARRVRHLPFRLAGYLRASGANALLAAMWPLTAVAPVAARLARFRGVVAVSEHTPLSRAYRHKGRLHELALRATSRIGYSLADVRIGVSSGVADDMARLSGLPRDSFDVVHNPASTGRVAASYPRPAILDTVPGPVILTVGTLKKVKRHDVLLDAFSRMPPESGATLCILGEGPERAALEAQVSRLGLSGRVVLPGFVVDPSPWYAAADLFALSSDYEGFGNVIVEAMEHGVPIVSTDCPSGPGEILEGGRLGRLVPVGDVDALARAMQESLQGTGDRERLKARARDFSVDTIARRYLQLLLPGSGGRP